MAPTEILSPESSDGTYLEALTFGIDEANGWAFRPRSKVSLRGNVYYFGIVDDVTLARRTGSSCCAPIGW